MSTNGLLRLAMMKWPVLHMMRGLQLHLTQLQMDQNNAPAGQFYLAGLDTICLVILEKQPL